MVMIKIVMINDEKKSLDDDCGEDDDDVVGHL